MYIKILFTFKNLRKSRDYRLDNSCRLYFVLDDLKFGIIYHPLIYVQSES